MRLFWKNKSTFLFKIDDFFWKKAHLRAWSHFDATKLKKFKNAYRKLSKPNFGFLIRLMKLFINLFEFVSYSWKNHHFSMIFLIFGRFSDFCPFFGQNPIFPQTSNCFREPSLHPIHLIFGAIESLHHVLNNDCIHCSDTSCFEELRRL